jgi:hypothetical protein
MAVPKYRLSEKTFIRADNTADAWMYDAGAEIFYSGAPSRNFIALNPEAEAAMALFAPLTGMQRNLLPRCGDPAP